MTFKCKIILSSILFLYVSCFFEQEPESKIPEREAAIIRRILQANAIDIKDDEWVDSYLSIDSFFAENIPNGTYYIILPQKGIHFLCLTDDINELTTISSKFYGISHRSGSDIETLIIKTDSIIKMQSLTITGRLKSIPYEIQFFRGKMVGFINSGLSILPEEIMELTAPPFFYDTIIVNFSGNCIDTTTISDTLDKWLQKYFTPYWKNTQVYE